MRRIDCRFTARVCASNKLCSLLFLLQRARFLSSNNLGGIGVSASVSSQTSIKSHYASHYLYSHLQSSRLTPHSHISLPSLAVNSFASYAAELTSLSMPHCLLSSPIVRTLPLPLHCRGAWSLGCRSLCSGGEHFLRARRHPFLELVFAQTAFEASAKHHRTCALGDFKRALCSATNPIE